MKKPVEVKIMGQKLQIRSDSDEAYVEEIASLVDERIKGVASKTKSVASAQVVILAAMNIADEYLRYKKLNSEKNSALSEKIEAIIEHIDLRL